MEQVVFNIKINLTNATSLTDFDMNPIFSVICLFHDSRASCWRKSGQFNFSLILIIKFLHEFTCRSGGGGGVRTLILMVI